MSTDAHAQAFKDYLAAETAMPVYDLDEAQTLGSGLPRNYVVLYLERRFGGAVRLSGRRANRLRRLSTRVVALTVTNGRLIEDRIAAAFEEPVDLGDDTAVVNYETGGGSFELDEGLYTAITDWTY